jgi:isoaspartyl peptidase/L-asparaginase-like protein (Ntn-hydrolase superfamily)
MKERRKQREGIIAKTPISSSALEHAARFILFKNTQNIWAGVSQSVVGCGAPKTKCPERKKERKEQKEQREQKERKKRKEQKAQREQKERKNKNIGVCVCVLRSSIFMASRRFTRDAQ